jgi:hypothetical protein
MNTDLKSNIDTNTYTDEIYENSLVLDKTNELFTFGKKQENKKRKIITTNETIKKIKKIKANIDLIENTDLKTNIDTNTYTDISGLANINILYENSFIKKWIKLIQIDKTISFDEYNRKGYFYPIADIVLDNEIFTFGKKKGNKKRKTLIQFIPTISTNDFKKKTEWLYLFVINGMIVKIGGTRIGVKGRVTSYLCGHHIEGRGKSGDCSKTNGFIYNTFEFYLKLGCKIQMYGYELPKTEITIEIFGKETKITTQTYHAYESSFMEDYKKNYSKYPILSDNCDPDYK